MSRVDVPCTGAIPLSLPLQSGVGCLEYFPACFRALSLLLAAEVWPLSFLLFLCPATPAGLLSPRLTHHSLLVLMLECDVPLLGEPTAELNKVPGNLCLRLAPWGERPASWHFPAEHITSPGSSKGSLAGGPEASGLQGQTASDRQAAHLWIPHVAPCPHSGMLANLTMLTEDLLVGPF